jgi:hypothetical protein
LVILPHLDNKQHGCCLPVEGDSKFSLYDGYPTLPSTSVIEYIRIKQLHQSCGLPQDNPQHTTPCGSQTAGWHNAQDTRYGLWWHKQLLRQCLGEHTSVLNYMQTSSIVPAQLLDILLQQLSSPSHMF